MSLILDALKKSEAERQLGRAPGLMSPMVRVSRRRGVSPWWGVLGLALVVGGFAGWWVATQRDAALPAPTAADAPARDAATAPRRAEAGAVQEAAVAELPPADASSPTSPAASSPADVSVPAQPAPADESLPAPMESEAPRPSDPDFDSVERESLPVDAAPRDVFPDPVPGERAPLRRPAAASSVAAPLPPPVATAMPSTVPPLTSGPSATTTLPPRPATTLPPQAATADAPSAASTSPAIDPASPPSPPALDESALATIDSATSASPAEPPLEKLPLITELLPDVRNALPPLKLSMHVFTAAPASRFVLIDGKRYTQGESVAASVRLEEIRRDGAVLDFNGKRFLVPRP